MNNLYRIFMLEATEKLTCTSFSIFLAQKKELFFPFSFTGNSVVRVVQRGK